MANKKKPAPKKPAPKKAAKPAAKPASKGGKTCSQKSQLIQKTCR